MSKIAQVPSSNLPQWHKTPLVGSGNVSMATTVNPFPWPPVPQVDTPWVPPSSPPLTLHFRGWGHALACSSHPKTETLANGNSKCPLIRSYKLVAIWDLLCECSNMLPSIHSSKCKQTKKKINVKLPSGSSQPPVLRIKLKRFCLFVCLSFTTAV